jgi:hypothetical protein
VQRDVLHALTSRLHPEDSMAGLPLKPVPALIGGAVGATIFLIPRLIAGHSGVFILIGVYAGIVLIAYIIGAATVGGSAGEFFRGLLIGATAAMNWAVASIVYPKIFGAPAGTIIALIVGVYAFLSIIPVLSRNAVYSGLLGYLNWLLPMSWLVVTLGFVFFLLGLLGALIGLAGATFFQLQRIAFHWQTGTLFTQGGWISNLNPIDTAFNMGNFAFADVKYGAMAEDHESGHTLNLAAFGSAFHLIGAFDENVIHGANAFSEQLAESHVPNTTRPALAMWL